MRFFRLQLTSHLSTMLIMVAIAYAAVLVAITPKWTVDDAYITFRYARNLALAGELNWNVGCDPVEGYTGVLWPLLLAPAFWLNLSPSVLSQVFGVVGWLAVAFFLERALKLLDIGSGVRATAVLLLMIAPIMPIHALSGLETTAFGAATLASLWTLLRAIRRNDVERGWMFLPALIAGLLRPEGALIGPVLALLGTTYLRRVEPRLVRPLLRRFLMWFVLPGLVYFLVRWNYYGEFLPNTFYAKNKSLDSHNQLHRLGLFWAGYLAIPLWACLPAVAYRLATRFRAADSDRAAPVPGTSSALLYIAMIGGTWGFQYLRTDPVMDYGFRYYAPIYPLALLSLAILFQWGWRATQRGTHRSKWLQAGLGTASVLVLIGQASETRREQWAQLAYTIHYDFLLQTEHFPVGRFLRDRVPPDEWLAVHVDAGVIPYVSNLKTIDFGQLNDEYLAGGRRTPQEWADYFFRMRPGALSMTSWDAHELAPRHFGGSAILADPRFAEYRLVAIFDAPHRPAYRQFVFLREDICVNHATLAERGTVP